MFADVRGCRGGCSWVQGRALHLVLTSTFCDFTSVLTVFSNERTCPFPAALTRTPHPETRIPNPSPRNLNMRETAALNAASLALPPSDAEDWAAHQSSNPTR